jgi:hypothetical protein
VEVEVSDARRCEWCDCLISLKAAIDAGARIVIEPASPEAGA